MLWWTMRKLKSANVAKREEAVRELGIAGATAPLVALLQTEDRPSVRIAAVRELTATCQFEPVVRLLLHDPDESVRVAAVRALAGAGNLDPIISLFRYRSISQLDKDWLRDQPSSVATAIVEFLNSDTSTLFPSLPPAKLYPPSVLLAAAESLLEGTGLTHIRVILSSILDLAVGGYEPASRVLLSVARMLPKKPDAKDNSSMVRALTTLIAEAQLCETHIIQARNCLAALGADSVGPLISRLKKKGGISAIRQLGQVNDPRVVDALTEVLMEAQESPDRGQLDLQEAAAHELLRIGNNRALESLRRAVRDGSSWMRVRAARLLAEVRDDGAADSLDQMLSADNDLNVRRVGILALGQLNNKSARRSLMKALREDPSDEIRSAAVDCLAKLDDFDTRDAVTTSLTEDKSIAVRLHIAVALSLLGVQLPATVLTDLLVEYVKQGPDLNSKDARKLASSVGIKPELVDAAVLVVRREPTKIAETGGGKYYHDVLSMDEGRTAVNKLCADSIPFTSGALRLVTQRADSTITLHSDCSGSCKVNTDFSEWRQLARQELIRRGIPA